VTRQRWIRLLSSAAIVCSQIALVPMLICPAGSAKAQPPNSTLDGVIHPPYGQTTAKQLAAELSQETGLSISVESAIEGRRLSVYLDGVTCRQALDSITHLEEWSWRELDSGHYRVERRIARVPQRAQDIPASLQAVLPRDIRTYLRLSDLNTKDPSAKSPSDIGQVASRDKARCLEKVRATVSNKVAPNSPVLLRSLPLDTREAMLLWITLVAAAEPTGVKVLNGEIAAYLIDPTRAVLGLEGSSLNVYSLDADFSFGAELQASAYRADGLNPGNARIPPN